MSEGKSGAVQQLKAALAVLQGQDESEHLLGKQPLSTTPAGAVA